MIKSVTMVSDTDSTIISVDAWYRFIVNQINETELRIANYCSDPIMFVGEKDEDDNWVSRPWMESVTFLPKELDYNFYTDEIVEILNDVLYEEMTTTVLLETMSGKGSEIGRSFEEIANIINRVKLNNKLGVCLDTCHVFSAGYDIVNHLDEVLDEFDKIIGLDRLKAIHLNDSKMPFASNKDRHEKIGYGTIGLEAIINIINHPKLKHLPFYLETPNELNGYKEEIELLKNNWRS